MTSVHFDTINMKCKAERFVQVTKGTGRMQLRPLGRCNRTGPKLFEAIFTSRAKQRNVPLQRAGPPNCPKHLVNGKCCHLRCKRLPRIRIVQRQWNFASFQIESVKVLQLCCPQSQTLLICMPTYGKPTSASHLFYKYHTTSGINKRQDRGAKTVRSMGIYIHIYVAAFVCTIYT